jgi:hypothetical protein
MLGAIAGDTIGSVFQHGPIKTPRFPLFHPLCQFTYDTALPVALGL